MPNVHGPMVFYHDPCKRGRRPKVNRLQSKEQYMGNQLLQSKRVKRNIVALCGPSGVGKGYLKGLIKEYKEFCFFEPIVATTRLTREHDGVDRLAGLSEKVFSQLISEKKVVLVSQPFGHNTPLYGFIEESFNPKSILTEVHSSILKDFTEYFRNDNLIILGLDACEDYLHNAMIENGLEYGDIELRIKASRTEREQIKDALDSNYIEKIWEINAKGREKTRIEIINYTFKWLKNITDAQTQQ